MGLSVACGSGRRFGRFFPLALAVLAVAATLSADPADFFTVTPCRVLDTRTPVPSPLSHGEERVVAVSGVCGVPSGASAVTLNLTVVDQSGNGFLVAYPADLAAPGVSTLNFNAAAWGAAPPVRSN